MSEQKLENAKRKTQNKTKAFALFCVLSFAFCVLSSSARADLDLSHSQEAIHAFNQGVERFNAKDCNAAVEHFDDAIAKDSDFAEAYYARGACRYSLQSTDGAMMDLSDAVRLKPDLLDARALRGVVYYEGDHWDDAVNDFNFVLEKNPQEAQSLLGRGVIRLRQEDIPGAEKDFRTFLKAYPTHPYAPKLRKILASLKGARETPEPSESLSVPNTPAHAGSPSARGRTVPNVQALADSLMRHREDLSDQYTKQILRGERGEAVGDITTQTGQATPPHANGGLEIVDPH